MLVLLASSANVLSALPLQAGSGPGVPVAAFTASPTSGTAPLQVNFTDLSSGTITSWAWSFGDGAWSSDQHPVHTYFTPGVYTVSLTVTGPQGSDTLMMPALITVLEPPPLADFGAFPTSGLPPLAVTFLDTSTGSISSWSWDFGDGGTSSQQNPAHTYGQPGLYTVSLTVSGPSGQSTETKTDYISVQPGPPMADFSAAPLAGPAPLSVAFTDLSSGLATAWFWSFGDGGTSSEQNPTHVYLQPGLYTVTLTAAGPGGVDTEVKSGYVNVSQSAPVADFGATPLSGLPPLTVSFVDFSTGNITSWLWDFGDGTTATEEEPVHVYQLPGSYTVSLTVQGPDGSDVEVKTDFITVAPTSPVADFSGTPTSGDVPLSVAFTDLSSGIVNGWFWSFGDGGASLEQHPVHVYTQAGTYSVTLTVLGPGGTDFLTRNAYVTVNGVPIDASFTAAPTTGFAPLAVQFTDTSSGEITSWFWSFGDGTSSTEQHPTHTYQQPGSYTVGLSVSGPTGSDVLILPGLITVEAPAWYLSFDAPVALPGGVVAAPEDIVLYRPSLQTWETHFDGSDVGLQGADIDAMQVFPGMGVLMSFSSPVSIPGLIGGPDGENVSADDLVFFGPMTMGPNTQGTFLFVLDGSDLGLQGSGGGIDGLNLVGGTGLALSFAAGSQLNLLGTVADEDVIGLLPTQLGAATSGTLGLLFDGSDVGLAAPALGIDALALDPFLRLVFSTRGQPPNGSAGNDLFLFDGFYGPLTSGIITLHLDLTALGILANVDAVTRAAP